MQTQEAKLYLAHCCLNLDRGLGLLKFTEVLAIRV